MRQKYTYIRVELLNEETGSTAELKFSPMLENDITHRWIEVLDMGLQLYQIDDPKRFYDFNPIDEENSKALELINRDIDIINNYQPIIERSLSDVNDQDTLNYLHNIFEVYHGHLDQQDATDFYANAPDEVKQALADLNIDVHRCEFVAERGKTLNPRINATWYGLPKTHHYYENDYKLFTNKWEFGTMYINYVEIGKPMLDLFFNDELGKHGHGSDSVFKPFDYFSADLHIKFWDVNEEQAKEQYNELFDYYKQHQSYFDERGISEDEVKLGIGMLPVAKIETDLSRDEVIQLISDHQHINKIEIIKE